MHHETGEQAVAAVQVDGKLTFYRFKPVHDRAANGKHLAKHPRLDFGLCLHGARPAAVPGQAANGFDGGVRLKRFFNRAGTSRSIATAPSTKR